MAALLLGITIAAGGACASGEGAPVAPHLMEIEAKIFRGSCVFSSCHGGTGPQEGLSLVSPTYAAIVDHPATQLVTAVRVAPGAPDRSYLLEKLASDSPAVGRRMPPDQPLDSALIATVRQWIVDGARDD